MADISQGGGLRDVNSGRIPVVQNPLQTHSNINLANNAVNAYGNAPRWSGGKNFHSQLLRLIMQLISLLKGYQAPQEPQPLKLDKQQDEAIRRRFSIFGELNYQVLDSNRDGKLSRGDELVVSSGVTGGEVFRRKLSENDVKAINGDNLQDARKALEENRQKWESQGIDDYSFTLQRSCFCERDAVRPVNIEVRNGEVTSATFADTGEPLPDRLAYNDLSVNDLFDTIEQAIANNAAEVNVEYDAETGIPLSIGIDQLEFAVDDEVSFSISNFREEPVFTTLAIGEEDNGGPIVKPPPTEEPPVATTKALGEEDGGIKPFPPIKPPMEEPPIATTLALGEEDGGYPGLPIRGK